MFRAAIAKQTSLGKRVEPILAAGDLVPDDLTVGLIRERLAELDAADGFVLDGFPRNLAQAEALDDLLAELDRPLTAVLELLVPERCASSGCSSGRPRKGGPTTRPRGSARLEIYHNETAPLSEHYRASDRLVGIDGSRHGGRGLGRDRGALEQGTAA